MLGVRVHRLQVIEGRGRIAKLPDALIVFPLTAPDTAEVEAQDSDVGVVEAALSVSSDYGAAAEHIRTDAGLSEYGYCDEHGWLALTCRVDPEADGSYEVNGGGLRFRRLFNYRQVGEMLFYDQENWGTEGAELSVDQVTSAYVEAEMRHISTVEMRRIRVEPLP